jgi:hypothetical protein
MAIKKAYLSLLEWFIITIYYILVIKKCPKAFYPILFYNIALYGHLHLLIWLKNIYIKNVKFNDDFESSQLIRSAVLGGHVDILKWLILWEKPKS